jgi:5-methylcytosine-specific restriction enzyme A
MPLLYHWQSDNYYRDAKFGFGYHLNQGNPRMQALQPGDSLWAFTRNKAKMYVLAAELIVRACTKNPPNYRYGPFRVWGDIQESRYFDVDHSPNAEPLIRALSVKSEARILGSSFQGLAAVRLLTQHDHQLLTRFTENLPVLDKVALYPEDEIEARLIHGDEAELAELMQTEDESRAASRRKYLYESLDIKRSHKLAMEVRTLYKGVCQICGFDPLKEYGFHLCHAHHIIWLSRGGEDDLSNLCLICPTHHSAVHTGEAVFDFGNLTFTYLTGCSERLQINAHL